MSMDYWGVVMYGIEETEIPFKEGLAEDYYGGLEYIFDTVYDNEYEICISLPSGKNVRLIRESTEENEFLGFSACYPWQKVAQGITQEDVENAIWAVLEPYVTCTQKELVEKINYINTYNCG